MNASVQGSPGASGTKVNLRTCEPVSNSAQAHRSSQAKEIQILPASSAVAANNIQQSLLCSNFRSDVDLIPKSICWLHMPRANLEPRCCTVPCTNISNLKLFRAMHGKHCNTSFSTETEPAMSMSFKCKFMCKSVWPESRIVKPTAS